MKLWKRGHDDTSNDLFSINRTLLHLTNCRTSFAGSKIGPKTSKVDFIPGAVTELDSMLLALGDSPNNLAIIL